MKSKVILTMLVFFIMATGYINAAENAVILWEKKLDGYIGNVKVADNGNVLFFYKSDIFSPAVDMVASNSHGDFFWNKRFIYKVRDFVISSTGERIAIAHLQPNQTGSTAFVTYIERGKEIWQLRGGEHLALAPIENYILSFNDGNDATGVFLYDLKGNLTWFSEQIFLKDGQSDNQGENIYGIQNDNVVFINVANKSVKTYKVNNPIIAYAFDPTNKFIFIADREKVICYDREKGEQWHFNIEQISKITPNLLYQKITVYTPGRAFVIPYDNPKSFYNLQIPEERVLKNLEISKDLYSFSENLKYLVAFKNKKLTLYSIGEN